jgi:hypothetical protein
LIKLSTNKNSYQHDKQLAAELNIKL